MTLFYLKSKSLVLFSLCIGYLMLSCATTPGGTEQPSGIPVEQSGQSQKSRQKQLLDMTSLIRTLRMDRAPSELGYEEKSFNSCQFEVNDSKTNNCGSRYLIVIHFQLLCRDRAGTVEQYSIAPIRSDLIHWRLGQHEGQTQSDHQGFGQIVLLSTANQSNKSLKLTIQNNFLILQASEIRKIVTPPDWCSRKK